MSKESFKNSMLAAGFEGTGKISKAGLVKCLDELKNGLTNPSDVQAAMTDAGFYSSTKISKSGLVAVFNAMKAGFNPYASTASFQLGLILALYSTTAKKISKQSLNKMLSVTADTVFIPSITFSYPDDLKVTITVASDDEYPIQITVTNIMVEQGMMIGIEKIVYNGRVLHAEKITDMQVTAGEVEEFCLLKGSLDSGECIIALWSNVPYQSSDYEELTAVIDGIRCKIRAKCTITI